MMKRTQAPLKSSRKPSNPNGVILSKMRPPNTAGLTHASIVIAFDICRLAALSTSTNEPNVPLKLNAS